MKKTVSSENYNRLHNSSRETKILEGIHSLLDWDQETYMPSAAAGIRSDQLKTLSGIVHKRKSSGPFVRGLGLLIDVKSGRIKEKGLTAEQQAALKEWRREYLIEKALPKKFVEDWAKLTSQSMHAWRHAREQNAFQQFSPFLEKIVSMARKKSELIGYKKHPYDALLDLYEPGMTTEEVAKQFTSLRKTLTTLIKKIGSAKQVDDRFLFGSFDPKEQLAFSHKLLQAVGYDLNRGRLDLSTHPFSSASHPTDSRITTRIHPTGLMSCISAVLHEAGHGLYEMGLPVEHYGSPLGEPISLGIHESQSRWWETLIGHSKPFWSHFLPILQQHFKGLQKISLDQFYKAVNKVQPGLIRIEADEVTYCLHVILRFELEVALIEGQLKVKELPEAWNGKMQELLGITPPSNKEGCLQDIHWSMGALGYFPTYALGNLYSAHLFFEGFAKKHKNWEKRVEQGELIFIKDWLAESVYKHGRRYSSLELLEKMTGKPFSADAYIKYLTNKYSKLYSL